MQGRETQTWYDSRALEREDKRCSIVHGIVRDRMTLKTPELETAHKKTDKEMQPWMLDKISLRVTKRTLNKHSAYLNHTI